MKHFIGLLALLSFRGLLAGCNQEMSKKGLGR